MHKHPPRSAHLFQTFGNRFPRPNFIIITLLSASLNPAADFEKFQVHYKPVTSETFATYFITVRFAFSRQTFNCILRMAPPKRSPVYRFFIYDVGKDKWKCKTCEKECAGSVVMNLRAHLERHHKDDLYQEFLRLQQQQCTPGTIQFLS